MPTNLKSLLSRSRSRNELKLRDKGDGGGENAEVVVNSSESVSGAAGSPGGGGQYGVNIVTTPPEAGINSSEDSDGSPTGTARRKDAAAAGKSFFSCSALHGLVSNSGGDGRICDCMTGGSSRVGKSDGRASPRSDNQHHQPGCSVTGGREMMQDSCGSLRKCETVLALSSFRGGGGNHPNSFTSSASSADMRFGKGAGGSSGAGSPTECSYSSSSSSGRVRGIKDKIFSTSSSTLNNLIHSSNRRLFPSWKVLSTSQSAAAAAPHVSTTTTLASTYEIPSSPLHCPAAAAVPTGCSADTESFSPLSHLCHAGGSILNGPPGASSCCSVGRNNANSHSQLSISEAPMTPVNRLRRNLSASGNSSNSCFLPCNNNNPPSLLYSGSAERQGGCSRSSSVASFDQWQDDRTCSSISSLTSSSSGPYDIFCRLCLSSYKFEDTCQLDLCSCRYCKDCLVAYVSFEIQEGAYDIACPDAACEREGVLSLSEIENLVSKSLMDKHRKFRLYREVEKDRQVMWCPTPGCETICMLQQELSPEEAKARPGLSRSSLTCSTCAKTFCAECKLSWHADTTCESHRRKLVKQGKLNVDDEEIYAIESIKKCPFCYVPIEKDSGCAQMMCKRCKHVFCWYCLSSLDDDFLLRHYDKGPCKNKLGHSRASVVWHRAQVIGIFAGFGVLVLLASPLLILAAPCLLCCRCRYCANKLDPEDPVSL